MSARENALPYAFEDISPRKSRKSWWLGREHEHSVREFAVLDSGIADASAHIAHLWIDALDVGPARAFLAKRHRVLVHRDHAEAKFKELKARWVEDTFFTSSVVDRVLHPGYQKIIGMGPQILPTLLRDLASEDSDWFWALEHISGENPVPQEEWGDRARMIHRWQTWGADRGYL